MPFARGHVVALRRRGVGVVLCADRQHVWVSPVGGCNGPPRHRAEIRLEPDEAREMGVPFKFPVVRCQTLLKVEIAKLAQVTPIGMAPESVKQKTLRSAVREAQHQVGEARLMFASAPGFHPYVSHATRVVSGIDPLDNPAQTTLRVPLHPFAYRRDRPTTRATP